MAEFDVLVDTFAIMGREAAAGSTGREAPPATDQNGGCLIATASFGSELAPQVQQLRELRDGVLLKTQYGTAFMSGFNQLYYSFSPTVADWERQNPLFREAVLVAITPMILSLSVLNHVEIDSDAHVLAYGLGIISLNAMLYVGLPVATIRKFRG